MIKILERYGAPHKLHHAMAQMFSDLKIVPKIGKAKAETGKKVGVRQVDCMAPVIFIYDHGVCRNIRY